jgi:DNA-binding transcriptional regulator/RsmH inhibitor MraZ
VRLHNVLIFDKGELVYTSPNDVTCTSFINRINRKADGEPIYSVSYSRPEVYIDSYQDKYSVDSKGRFRIASARFQERMQLDKEDNVVGKTEYTNTKNNEWLNKINKGSYYSLD